jgi:hypothetical protein
MNYNNKLKVKSNEGGRKEDAVSLTRAVVSVDRTKKSLYHWFLKCAPQISRGQQPVLTGSMDTFL